MEDKIMILLLAPIIIFLVCWIFFLLKRLEYIYNLLEAEKRENSVLIKYIMDNEEDK